IPAPGTRPTHTAPPRGGLLVLIHPPQATSRTLTKLYGETTSQVSTTEHGVRQQPVTRQQGRFQGHQRCKAFLRRIPGCYREAYDAVRTRFIEAFGKIVAEDNGQHGTLLDPGLIRQPPGQTKQITIVLCQTTTASIRHHRNKEV